MKDTKEYDRKKEVDELAKVLEVYKLFYDGLILAGFTKEQSNGIIGSLILNNGK